MTPDAYRLEQARLAGRAATVALSAWQAFVDPVGLDATFPLFSLAVGAMVQDMSSEAAQAATEFYGAQREAAGVPGTAPRATFRPDPRAVTGSLIVQGPVSVKRAMTAGRTVVEADAAAASKVAAAAYRHVANAGRLTVARKVLADPGAYGYARASDGNPCAFCAMLVSRGPVYKRDSGTGSKYHDRCGCYLVPSFSQQSEPSPAAAALRELWNKSGGDFAAFRRSIDSTRR